MDAKKSPAWSWYCMRSLVLLPALPGLQSHPLHGCFPRSLPPSQPLWIGSSAVSEGCDLSGPKMAMCTRAPSVLGGPWGSEIQLENVPARTIRSRPFRVLKSFIFVFFMKEIIFKKK